MISLRLASIILYILFCKSISDLIIFLTWSVRITFSCFCLAAIRLANSKFLATTDVAKASAVPDATISGVRPNDIYCLSLMFWSSVSSGIILLGAESLVSMSILGKPG